MNDSEIFRAAAELPSDQRDDYLANVYADNPGRLQEMRELLEADGIENSFLERAAVSVPDATVDDPAISERPGSQVGKYRLMEQVGEGGFGLVFVAEQHHPVRRKVALKIIKPGMDTREVVARFEAERQALALMDHPNIAKVLDAGTTHSGRPFFVMELIRGVTLVQYCDDQKLTTEKRLELFVDVCRAVQHAHAKGVIHRDLKPSNVLVSPHDGIPVVKVIDFGIAKAIGQQLTDKTIYTRLTQMIGTPLYMSPEQAEINALDVDTRSDVYSLGVLLYELLTGTTPFDRERFSRAAFEEIKRIIREEDPPSPSRRLSTLGDTIQTVSQQRQTDGSRLTASLRGELDWIVMCCLEKERSRRYQTAAELAADVNRYLDAEPVQVAPPSRVYRLRKTMHRHRVALAIAASYVVLSMAIIGVVGIQNRRVMQQQELAAVERDRALDALMQLKDVSLEQALAAALSGDESQFEAAMGRLPDLADDESTARHLKALFGIISGYEVQASIRDMEELVKSDPDDLGAWSILSIAAENITLDLDADSSAEGHLYELIPDTELEKILKSIALPESGVEELERFLKERPGWAIARAALAKAHCDLWHVTRDATHLESARREIDVAKLLMPDHPMIKSVELRAITAEFVDQDEKSLDTTDILAVGRRQAEELRKHHQDFAFGRLNLGEFYTATGDHETAISIWEQLIKDHDSLKAKAFVIPLWVLVDREPAVDRQQLPTGYFHLSGDARSFRRLVLQDSQKHSKLFRAWLPIQLRYLGQEERAERVANQIEPLTRNHAWWIANVAKLGRGDIDAEEMMRDAKDNRRQQTHHCMAIAWDRLVKEDGRQEAIEYLDRAIALNHRVGDTYYWCLAMRKKLEEEPDWPASFKAELMELAAER